ncbi:SAF domain-containing protein [Propionibacterium australiense]|nr:SAF domain-containing protein [Propionibacterium australiense]SYZ33650.1 Antifreeze-like/N-acetylneuraminic acid synthase C-terminal [Propionibacterium australiense]VEH88870.1 Flp pilus assembly protein CpaB [Propionibacterium australiense]
MAPAHPMPTFLQRAAGPSLRARRSPRLILVGVLCACLGGLGCVLAWQQTTHARQVVVAARALAKGEPVDAAALTTTSIGVAAGVSTVPAEDIDTLIGQTALVDLPAGSLVAADAIGEPRIADGFSVVGLHLPAGRVPGTLTPGSTVILATAPAPTDDPDAEFAREQTPGTVVGEPAQASDGSWSLDVQVPADIALHLASLAAVDRLVVVQTGGA